MSLAKQMAPLPARTCCGYCLTDESLAQSGAWSATERTITTVIGPPAPTPATWLTDLPSNQAITQPNPTTKDVECGLGLTQWLLLGARSRSRPGIRRCRKD